MRVGGDLFLNLGPGRDLLALVVVDLVSLGLNLGKKQFVTLVQQRFLILVRSSFVYSIRNCLGAGNCGLLSGFVRRFEGLLQRIERRVNKCL